MSFSSIVIEFGIVRVYTDCGVDILILLGNGNSLSKIIRLRITGPDIEHRCNARSSSTLNNLVPVRIKLLAINMTVGIDEDHFKRAPICTSSRNVAIAGVSSSVKDAAQIIPCDSRPRILRGFRLATTTTLRP